MRMLPKSPSFKEFLLGIPTSNRSQYDTLTATDAVELLRRVFDTLLIGVDEISKSKKDKIVMRQLCAILDKFKDVDVILSSLSPEYVRKLVTDSQRPIDYLVLPPLLDAKLGMKECAKWAEKISKLAYTKKEDVDMFKLNILRNTYLLYSGHPRSIQKMVVTMKSEETDWSEVVENLTKKKSAISLIYILVETLNRAATIEYDFTVNDLENFVLMDAANL